MKDVVRDLVVHPENQELLLSCGQDKTARITNLSSCMEVAKFTSESELWACAWGPGGAVYLGTKRSQVEVRNIMDYNDILKPQQDTSQCTVYARLSDKHNIYNIFSGQVWGGRRTRHSG